MTPTEAKRTFADLMQKARTGQLTERDRGQLTIARQTLRREKRPAMNPERSPKDFLKEAIERHKRGDSGGWSWVFFQQMKSEDRKTFDEWLVKNQDPLAYQPGTTEHRFRTKVFEGLQKKNPRKAKKVFDVLHSGGQTTRFFKLSEAKRFLKRHPDGILDEHRIGERKGPVVSPAKRNPRSSIVRVGRAEEVRYHRDIGSQKGFYKHAIRSRRAGVFTIPAGWVYVGSKSILITEGQPRT